MATPNAIPQSDDQAVILRTDDERDLYRVMNPLVQAVIYMPRSLPDWFDELEATVKAGGFEVPRTVLPNATREQIEDWLENNLPFPETQADIRGLVKIDILALVDHVGRMSGASRFMLRILTAEPNTECGFHVDTVPLGASPCGLLRVYTGAGTDYVDPSNVTSTADFYRYLSRRERLSRDRTQARRDQDVIACEQLDREIEQLDHERPFLRDSENICTASAGSIVSFKYLDVSSHWSNHAKSMAWIHSSPMAGERRFLVNISPDESSRSPRPRRKDTSAH